MTAYVIGKLIVKDWDWYREYRSVTEPLIAEHGGRYLVKGGDCEKLEGVEPAGHASVLVAFPDRQAAMNWYNDPRYAAMIALRRDSGVICDLAVVDGLDTPTPEGN
ncbi:hypothetical protein MB02_03080 [Croceicoccus estronivorus]|uniref:DUF1330 domain-containing protein n=1 Tax=Croceicoccus estronivorus TaxID=1172626 RepID=UPI00082F0A5E|nr:DUF1330 domain-containing protein [Croceicoccus estronivorus]OCC25623.1 hypothetical protein MB02_03080 [Croceicoccus estronivorus]